MAAAARLQLRKLVLLALLCLARVPAGAQDRDLIELERFKRDTRPIALPTLVLWRGAETVSALGNVRVHEQGEHEDTPIAFSFYPDLAAFKPVVFSRRWGEALQNPSRDMWLVFTVLNSSGSDDWLLSAYRAAFKVTELRIVGENGVARSWSGEALDALRIDPGVSDAVALRLPLPTAEKGSVYLRLSGAAYPWLDLSLCRYGTFVRRVATANIGFALLGSAAAALSLLVLAASAVGPYRRLGYFPYALLFFAIVIISYSLMALGLTRVPGLWPGTLLTALAFLITGTIAALGCLGLARGQGRAALLKALWLLSASGLAVGLYSSFQPSQALDDYSYRALAIVLCLQAFLTSVLCFVPGQRGKSPLAEADVKGDNAEDRFALSAAIALMPGLDNVAALLDELAEGFPDPEKTALTTMARAETLRIMSIAHNALLYMRLRGGQLRLHDENFNLAALIQTCLNQARQLSAASPRIEPLDLPIIELRNDLGCMHLLFYSILARCLRGQGLTRLGIRANSDLHLIMVDIEDDGPPPFALASGFNSHGLDALERAPFDLSFSARLAKSLGGSLGYERRAELNAYSFVFPRSMRWDESSSASGADQAPLPEGSAAVGPAAPEAYAPPDLGDDTALHIEAVSDAEAAAVLEDAARRRFALLEPVPRAKPAPDPWPVKMPLRRPSARGVILLVDDDPLSLFTLKRRLESGGWLVEGRLSTADLVEQLDAMVCHAVLVNASLPGQSGLEFCKALRRSGGRDLLPVILIIDSARPEDIELAFTAGANDYLIRPIGGRELLARVQIHVDLAAGVQRDLEQRARMAEVDKFKTLGWLTAGVAHEINTPNNAALRNVPLLKEVWAELLEPLERIYAAEGDFRIRGFSYEDLLAEVPEILNDLYMGAQHIRKIVTDLKDYARGPDPGGRALTDINQVISYAARLLKHDIALASDAVSFELAEDLPPVMADRLKLTQVMVNVLENALQALPDRSRAILVRSAVERPDEGSVPWLKILVRDEGIGMDERTLASAFDPFFSTKRERGGTGLGLAVAVGIVRDLGGAMEIHSSLGAGTELLIRLPAESGALGGTK